MRGLNNKILEVDLNHDKLNEVHIPEQILLDYIGGRGLGVKLLSDKLRPNLNPLDPENLLIFASLL